MINCYLCGYSKIEGYTEICKYVSYVNIFMLRDYNVISQSRMCKATHARAPNRNTVLATVEETI